MSLIDASYFVADLNIPNTDNAGILERVNWYISKYEPDVLLKMMGYPLFKAFAAGIAVAPPATPDIRYIDMLYGKEYTNLRGELKKWKGIIKTSNPIFNMSGGFVYKKPEYLYAGTMAFPSDVDTVTFDGTNGSPDWRGWTPIITRTGVMQPGIDYSFDKVTGIWSLLQDGDVFGDEEYFFAEFELRTDSDNPLLDNSQDESLIANYVYYWYVRMLATQSTGFGEVQQNAENAVNQSPNQKMARAWNVLSEWVCEFIEFMMANPSVYPEFTWQIRHHVSREFQFVNPIF